MKPIDLARSLQGVRGFGWVFCAWRRRVAVGEPEVNELDEFVFSALGGEADPTRKDGYREVTDAEARHIVGHWMKNSMAYDEPLSGSGLVSVWAEPFFLVFSAARYFTNGNASIRGRTHKAASSEWMPKTRHTFDSGIVAADSVNIGLIWFADED